MSKIFTLEGADYDIGDLTEGGQNIWSRLLFALPKLDELNGQHAVLTRAKTLTLKILKVKSCRVSLA